MKDMNKYTIYYLPEHHYIGMTCRLPERIREHRNSHNRITEGYEVMMDNLTKEKATYLENYLHSIGYNGSQYTEDINKHRSIKIHQSKPRYRALVQMDLDGNILNEFISISDANVFLGKTKSHGSINNCIKGRANTAHKSLWRYKN